MNKYITESMGSEESTERARQVSSTKENETICALTHTQ